MKKAAKRILSIVLVLCMLMGVVAFDALAQEQPAVKYHYYNFAEFALPEGYLTEIVDGILYAYIVEDGEVAILNIQIQKKDMEESPLVFPNNLGGYPVTTIGGYRDEIFIYLSYTDSIYPEGYDENTGYGYAEYDPNRYWVSEYIIPEGYKYIEDHSMYNLGKVTFPKSLRVIDGSPFDMLYTYVDENGKNHTVLPECYYTDPVDMVHSCLSCINVESITLPSRIADNSSHLLYLLRSGPDLYVPSNISTEDFHDTLYYYEAAAGDAGEIWPRQDASCTIHCAPDSEFLSVFDEYGEHPYATIITDVTPAEYIQFPEDTVNVQVGDVVDLEAKTYPAEAVWTACSYEVSDPSIVQIDDYSGRITALKEGTVTVTATHCERGFVDTCTVNVTTEPEPVSGITEIKPATDTPYYSYGNRDYKLELTGSPNKIQLIRQNGSTTTIDRSKATITSNGETETWVVNMCVEAGEHAVRAKYGKVWDETTVPFTVTYDVLDPVYGVSEIRPATDAPYYSYGNREYILDVAGSPSKIQVVCNNGSTITVDRSIAQITSNGETETWVVNMRVGAGEHAVRAKYGKAWADKLTPFTVTYDTPKAYSFNLTYENGIGTFDVVTDPQISKVQFALDNGCTLTYSQSVSYIGEDGLRHWTMTRKIATGRTFTLRTKLGNVWTNTDFEVNTII